MRHLVGGIRTYIRYVYPFLEPNRHTISVFANASNESHTLAQDLSPHDAHIHLVDGSQSFLEFVRALSTHIRHFRPDLIHAHGYTAGAAAALAKGIGRVPLLVTSHDVLRDEQFTSGLKLFAPVALSMLLARAAAVQSVSKDAQDNLVTWMPLLKRCTQLTVIPNGIDVRMLPPLQNTDHRRAQPLLFVGRLMPQKGFLDLVEAVRLLKESQVHVQVDVAGDGGYVREYRAHIADLGLDSAFRFLGFVSDTRGLLMTARAVVVPSRWEAGPLVPMEALVTGCPLVASRCIGLREVIAGAPVASFEPGDVRELASHLKQVWLQPEPTIAAAAHYVTAARQRFDSRNTAVQLDALIERLLGRSSS